MGKSPLGPRTFPHPCSAISGQTAINPFATRRPRRVPINARGRLDLWRATAWFFFATVRYSRTRCRQTYALGGGVQPRRHLPERTALTFCALRDSNFRTANGVMTGPEHIVDSGRRPQVFNGHAKTPPAARPWDSANPIAGHMTLRIDTEQTTYPHSTLAVEDSRLRFVGACLNAHSSPRLAVTATCRDARHGEEPPAPDTWLDGPPDRRRCPEGTA